MKRGYENALLLGGAYAAGDVLLRPLSEGVSEPARILWFFGFLIAALMLILRRPPRFIGYLNERFPDLALILKSVGWLPYFIAVFFFSRFAVSRTFGGNGIYPLGTGVLVGLTAACGIVSVAAYVAMRAKRRKKP